MTAVLGFPYPQERICNLKIFSRPLPFGSEPVFKLARHRITLLICKSRCHVQVTADNELLARRARRKGRAEYEVQERRSSGGPWRSGCVRARAACVAAHAAAWPARIGRCHHARGRPGETRAKRANGERGAVRARAVHRQAGAEAAARGARLAPVQDLRVRALSRRVRTYRYVFTSYNNR